MLTFIPKKTRGFTIVELLIVIVVIAVLAAISVVAYNGVQERASNAKRESDLNNLYKGIILARQSQGKSLRFITLNTYSAGSCLRISDNPSQVEPRDLPKSHVCWTTYYTMLDRISQASSVDLAGLRTGDSRGNPYVIDENENETATCPTPRGDYMHYFTGSGVGTVLWKELPNSGFAC